jgi:hypothetical protein
VIVITESSQWKICSDNDALIAEHGRPQVSRHLRNRVAGEFPASQLTTARVL